MDLPASVQEVADIIGRDLALHLVSVLPLGRGSKRKVVYVPKRLSVTHALVSMLGYPAALKMSRHFGGEILFLSNCSYFHARQRHDEMRSMARDGIPIIDIAQAFGLTTRRVKDVLAEMVAMEQPVPGADNHPVDISKMPIWTGTTRVARNGIAESA